MTAPVCPVHQKPMRLGRRGYFCPVKVSDSDYCSQTAPKPVSAPTVASGEQGTTGTSLPLAALAFAGQVFQGSSDTDFALQCYRAALAALKESA